MWCQSHGCENGLRVVPLPIAPWLARYCLLQCPHQEQELAARLSAPCHAQRTRKRGSAGVCAHLAAAQAVVLRLCPFSASSQLYDGDPVRVATSACPPACSLMN